MVFSKGRCWEQGPPLGRTTGDNALRGHFMGTQTVEHPPFFQGSTQGFQMRIKEFKQCIPHTSHLTPQFYFLIEGPTGQIVKCFVRNFFLLHLKAKMKTKNLKCVSSMDKYFIIWIKLFPSNLKYVIFKILISWISFEAIVPVYLESPWKQRSQAHCTHGGKAATIYRFMPNCSLNIWLLFCQTQEYVLAEPITPFTWSPVGTTVLWKHLTKSRNVTKKHTIVTSWNLWYVSH